MIEEIPITIWWPSWRPVPRQEPEPQPAAVASKPPRRRTTKQAEINPIILATLAKHGPSGVDRIAKLAGLESKQISPRMKGLMESGKIRETGNSVLSARGAPQREWELVR
jgi:predicted transcriptional regulator